MTAAFTNPPKACPSPTLLRASFDYDTESGHLRWKTGNYRGHIAGTLDRAGYIRVIFQGRSWPAHRLAWAIAHGSDAVGLLDHVNGVKSDNRLLNLRVASATLNIANRPAAKGSACGLKGVSRHSNKWRARIKVGGKEERLGDFDTPHEAHLAYREAARKIYGEFATSSNPPSMEGR